MSRKLDLTWHGSPSDFATDLCYLLGRSLTEKVSKELAGCLNQPCKFPSESPCERSTTSEVAKRHPHYHRPMPAQTADVYRVLLAFGVADPCIQHAVKKLLVAGARGAGKDITKDVQEAIDSLLRWHEMRAEEGTGA